MSRGQEENRISERRVEAGLSRYALAKLARVKWETLRDIEAGKRTPRPSTLARIDRALRGKVRQCAE